MIKKNFAGKATPMPDPISIRSMVLRTAEELTTGDRNVSYNDPKINMMAFEELLEWAAKWQKRNTDNSACGAGHDAAMVMVYAKLARIVVGAAKMDNYVDAAAYLAMAWECEERAKDALPE